MSDEQQTEKRTRKPNPYTAYAKAHTAAEKARRAAARAEALAAAAKEAADKASALADKLPELERAEKEAYDNLQEALAELGTAAGEDVEEDGE